MSLKPAQLTHSTVVACSTKQYCCTHTQSMSCDEFIGLSNQLSLPDSVELVRFTCILEYHGVND